jgi:hypothetical protein
MADKSKEDRRSSVGSGSTYRKGKKQDLGSQQEIGSVVGGQVWLVKPNKKAKASNPCLWMQAGVVKFKNCDNYYDCTTCKYDHAMESKAAKGKQLTWQNAMRRLPSIGGPAPMIISAPNVILISFSKMSGPPKAKACLMRYSRLKDLTFPWGFTFITAMPGHALKAGDTFASVSMISR